MILLEQSLNRISIVQALCTKESPAQNYLANNRNPRIGQPFYPSAKSTSKAAKSLAIVVASQLATVVRVIGQKCLNE